MSRFRYSRILVSIAQTVQWCDGFRSDHGRARRGVLTALEMGIGNPMVSRKRAVQ